MKRSCNRSSASGLTLVEMLVTMSLVGIMAAISIPSYISWKPGYRLRQASHDMLSDFQTVRDTAVKRNVQCAVSLDQTIGGETYDYVGYVDADSDFKYDSGEEILVSNRFSKYGYVSFVGDDFLDGSGEPTLAFRFDGIPLALAGAGSDPFPSSGSLTIDNTRGKLCNLNISVAGAIWLE
jgi:prepilin-type N-terminal cleavage/methylation domain-containing protein